MAEHKKKKPLIRWTVGGTIAREGLEALELACSKVSDLYPECDLLIVYNNLTDRAIKFIEKIGVPMTDGSKVVDMIFNPPLKGAEWLIWPPRLRMDAHEICMDNDIILLRRHPVIDMFLSSKDFFFATQSKIGRNYGEYEEVVPHGGQSVNSGLYGMPPGFDFLKWMINFYIRHGRREYHHTNPQGVVAAMLKEQTNHRIIPKQEILLSSIMRSIEDRWDEVLDDKVFGLHFCGVNRSLSCDVWVKYKLHSSDKHMNALKEKWNEWRTIRCQ